MAGETSPGDEVVITFEAPARAEPAEYINLSVEIASTGVELVPGNPVVVQIPAGAPLPTVSLSTDKTSIAEGDTATITVTLSEELERQVAFTLTSTGDSARYGTFTGDDYYIVRNDGVNCARVCSIAIAANTTSVDLTVRVVADSMNETTAETFTSSLTVNSTSTDIVALGSPSVLNFTIPAEALVTHTVSFSEASNFLDEGRDTISAEVQITISPVPTEAVNIPIVLTGDRNAFVMPVMLSAGATLTLNDEPDNNGVIAIPANTGSVTLTMFPTQDADDTRDDITISFGALPSGYGPGMISSWELAIHDDD